MNTSIWIEKYRPKNFNEIIGQDKNIEILKNLINNNSLPHLLFHGESGVGKTSTINSIVNKLYGNNKAFVVMKLDASDDRGINSVRDEIKGFAEKMTINNKGIKLIILDEADSMTFDAQFALRRIIEKYSDNTRFCLICNYENKIIQPIKSRCVDIRFYPIKKEIIKDKLIKICKIENINYDEKGLETIANLSNGDLRKSINVLQSIQSLNKKINSSICFNTLGVPKIKTMKKILDMLLDDKITLKEIINTVNDKIILEGISISQFIKSLFEIINSNIENIIKIKGESKYMFYIESMSEIEEKCIISTFSDIYIISLISIFKKN